jgi:uncharacterized membrane protein YphA (DoxX/SURF4 family)
MSAQHVRSQRVDNRLRTGGSAAIAVAILELLVGIEFLLAGLSKAFDSKYIAAFGSFMRSSPGTKNGPIASLVQSLVVPHLRIAGLATEALELAIGVVLLVAAEEAIRRRIAGPLGAPQGYEPVIAFLAGLAGLAVAAESAVIYLLGGGALPGVTPANALMSPIAAELLLVFLGLVIAVFEFGRFGTLRRVAGKT